MTNDIQMNALSLNSQLLQSALSTGQQISKMTPQPVSVQADTQAQGQNTRVYAQEGDDNYNAEMDANGDGTVTYDEYMAYCEKNAVSQYSENPGLTVVEHIQNPENNIQSIRPINIGKALSTYSSSEINLPTAFVANEA